MSEFVNRKISPASPHTFFHVLSSLFVNILLEFTSGPYDAQTDGHLAWVVVSPVVTATANYEGTPPPQQRCNEILRGASYKQARKEGRQRQRCQILAALLPRLRGSLTFTSAVRE